MCYWDYWHHIPSLAVGALFLTIPPGSSSGSLRDAVAHQRHRFAGSGSGWALIGAEQLAIALAPQSLIAVLAALALMGLGTSQELPNAISAINQNAGPHRCRRGSRHNAATALGAWVSRYPPH